MTLWLIASGAMLSLSACSWDDTAPRSGSSATPYAGSGSLAPAAPSAAAGGPSSVEPGANVAPGGGESTNEAVGAGTDTPLTGAGGAAGEASNSPTPADIEPIWVGSWATGPQLTEPSNLPPAPGLSNNTLRQTVFTTLTGSRLRLLLSNEFGDAPVTFESVHVANASGGSSIEPGSDRGLLFAGSESVTVPAGQAQYSDPIDHEVSALSSLAISIRFGQAPAAVTGHPGSRTTSYLQSGDAVAAESLPAAATTDHWYFITGVDVEAQPPSAALVVLGDSISDGRGSTTNGNDRWPDFLARRLQANPVTQAVSVLNQGIGGNAVVSGGLGPTAIARFERDVLNQRGVRWVIVLEGVNDIGGAPDASVGDRLIAAFDGFIDSAHERDLHVYGVPILPFGGSSYDSPAHEAARQAVNQWIRTSGRFDAVLDLDQVVADPAAPSQLLRAYDSGDGLHLSPAGYRAMAEGVELGLFEP